MDLPTQVVHVAAKLGIADQLADDERSTGDLAAACDRHPDTLFRLLRGLASLGGFRETTRRTFTLTPLAERRAGVP